MSNKPIMFDSSKNLRRRSRGRCWSLALLSLTPNQSLAFHCIKRFGVTGYALRSKSEGPRIQRHGGTQPAGQAKVSGCCQKDRCKVEHNHVPFLEFAFCFRVLFNFRFVGDVVVKPQLLEPQEWAHCLTSAQSGHKHVHACRSWPGTQHSCHCHLLFPHGKSSVPLTPGQVRVEWYFLPPAALPIDSEASFDRDRAERPFQTRDHGFFPCISEGGATCLNTFFGDIDVPFRGSNCMKPCKPCYFPVTGIHSQHILHILRVPIYIILCHLNRDNKLRGIDGFPIENTCGCLSPLRYVASPKYFFFWWQVWDDGSIQVAWLQLNKAIFFDPTLSLVGTLLYWSLVTGWLERFQSPFQN